MKRTTKPKLTPPDPKRCQAIKRVGAFAFGPPSDTRCSNAPTVIATEKKPGKDGLVGSMSLCDACSQILRIQQPGFAKFDAITVPKKRHKTLGPR